MQKILKHIAFVSLIFLAACQPEIPVNWEPTFDSTHRRPYGTYVLRNELENIFPNSKITNISEKTFTFLEKTEYDWDEQNYMFIYPNSFHGKDTWQKVFYFVNQGGSAFIANENFNDILLDSLKINVTQNSISEEKTIHFWINQNKYAFKKGISGNYFSDYDKENTEILGFVEVNGAKHPNYIKVYNGLGYFLLHCEPFAFTNYHMLRDNRYKYVTECFSSLDDDEIWWNNNRIMNREFYEPSDGNMFSGLSFIMKHKSLKFAFFILITMGLSFLIFNYKRIQRHIPILLPYENKSLSFVKTISLLYKNNNGYSELIRYKINYFLERIRDVYHLSTDEIKDNFAEILSSKSGVEKSLCVRLISHINLLQNKERHNKENFIKLQSIIQEFNQKTNLYGRATK